jgi:hypothetical protein
MTRGRFVNPQTGRSDGPGTGLDRRRWLGRVGALGLGAAAMGYGLRVRAADPPPDPDPALLNFALNLEYLQAEFYLRAVGRSLDESALGGSPGGVTGGAAVPFQTDAFRQFAQEIASDQQAHVAFLRATIGDGAISEPAINFTDAFNAVGRAAGLVGPDEAFDPFADELSFLLGAFFFEDVGVTAYKGLTPFLNGSAIIEAVAGLLAVEAYQAGEIRTVLFGLGSEAQAAANAISALRNALTTPADVDQGLTTIVASDTAGTPLPTRAPLAVPEQIADTVRRLPGAAVSQGDGGLVVRRAGVPVMPQGDVGTVMRAGTPVVSQTPLPVTRARPLVVPQESIITAGAVRRQLPAVQQQGSDNSGDAGRSGVVRRQAAVAQQDAAPTGVTRGGIPVEPQIPPTLMRGQTPVVAQGASGVLTRAGTPVTAQLPEGLVVTANIIPDDANGLAFSRTISEVLRILYLTPLLGQTSGGFFPEGVNGEFETT